MARFLQKKGGLVARDRTNRGGSFLGRRSTGGILQEFEGRALHAAGFSSTDVLAEIEAMEAASEAILWHLPPMWQDWGEVEVYLNGVLLTPEDLFYEEGEGWLEWREEKELLLPHYEAMAADARIRGDDRWTRYERGLRAKTRYDRRKGFGKVGFRGATGRSGERGSPGRRGRTWLRDTTIRRDRALVLHLLGKWEREAEMHNDFTVKGDNDCDPQEGDYHTTGLRIAKKENSYG